MRILALEPYYGGSHRAVLDGLVERIDADWTVFTLPARKWKWRMRGAAITMAEEAREAAEARPFDLILASTFVNLAEFKGLAGPEVARVPSIVYFHENQLVYPNRHTAEWDYQFPLTNITSALAADRCLFNTQWNLDGFIGSVQPFISEFPDHHPAGLAARIAEKSEVLHPPFDDAPFSAAEIVRGERLRIVWPHRWEHDKNPEEFFEAVSLLADRGLDFEVVVAGQAFKETRAIMDSAASRLGERLVHCGEPRDRAEYARLLSGCDIAVSTANNEFFGLAMIEACCAGCFPLVPDRLAYPELYDDRFRYASTARLVDRLADFVSERPAPCSASDIARRFTFDRLTPTYESVFSRVARGTVRRPTMGVSD